jgi:hypothetical protein
MNEHRMRGTCVQAKTGRQIHKSVALPLEGRSSEILDVGSAYVEVSQAIHVHCTADAFNTKKMVGILKRDIPDAEVYSRSECVHCQLKSSQSSTSLDADVFFFEVSSVPSSGRRLQADATRVACLFAPMSSQA